MGTEISPLASLGRNDIVFDLSSRAQPRDLGHMAQKALHAPCVYCCRAFILSHRYVLHGSNQITVRKWAVLVYINPIFPISCVQRERARKTILGRRRFGIGRVNGKLARLRIFCPRALFSPPLRFARVSLKNRLNMGGFSLHKTDFSVFMRAIRESAVKRNGRNRE